MKEKIMSVLKSNVPVIFTVVAAVLILTALTEVVTGMVSLLKNHKAIVGVIFGATLYNKIKEFISAKIK